MYTSRKPTIYIVDGHNFVRSCLNAAPDNEEEVTKEFLDRIEEVSESDKFSGSFFRIIFDGGFRPLGASLRSAMKVTFAESVPADELIFEQALYLYNNGRRVVVVTSDRGLQEEARSAGIKTMFCEKFLRIIC